MCEELGTGWDKIIISCELQQLPAPHIDIYDENTKVTLLSKVDFFDLSPLFKCKTIMTGTPVANRPYDIWAQVYFLDEGQSLGNDFKEFKKKTNLRNDFENNEKKRNEFEKAVSSISIKFQIFQLEKPKKVVV